MATVIKVSDTLSYNPDAAEYRPHFKRGHPFLTTTRFMKDETGKPARDVEGYMVPLPNDVGDSVKRRREMAERLAARRIAQARAIVEATAIAKERRRVNKRQAIGDPMVERSRDEDFPLMAVLRREGMVDAIGVVLAYRRLVATCAAEPLKGMSYSGREATGLSVVYHTNKLNGVAEVDAAKAAGFRGKKVPGGEIEYKRGVKVSSGAYDIPARRKEAVAYDDNAEPTAGRTESLHIRVTEDVLLDRIDRFPTLLKIRAALGPLVDAFEDAVLGGQTLMKIGNDRGFTGTTAATAGKAIVMEAIAEVSRYLLHKKPTPANDNYMIEKRKIA